MPAPSPAPPPIERYLFGALVFMVLCIALLLSLAPRRFTPAQLIRSLPAGIVGALLLLLAIGTLQRLVG